MSHVLTHDAFLVSNATFEASAYAVVIATNIGDNFTLIGALAGLMWRNILRTKGIEVS